MRPRIRTVKPDIFHDEQLWLLGEETHMPVLQGFQGLWCYSDREGRFEWRPMALKSLILPYWGGDFAALLDALVTAGMVVKYTVGGRAYGWVRNLLKHQSINAREPASVLPPPPDHVVHVRAYAESTPDTDTHGDARVEWEGNGKGMGSGGGMGVSRQRDHVPPSSEVPKQEAMPEQGQGIPTTWHSLKGWTMSDELRAEAIVAGVPAGDIDRRVKDLGIGPIGGARGVFDRDDYVRNQFGKWKTWGETERAKAMGASRLDPDDKLQRQADRVSMLRAQEAAEEAGRKAAP